MSEQRTAGREGQAGGTVALLPQLALCRHPPFPSVVFCQGLLDCLSLCLARNDFSVFSLVWDLQFYSVNQTPL